ncbi:acyltransferase family protein [uncultured Enterovirga sp.]|uniref:acyltransferase family protein n=1 Tax=uncultured Enterovirga sp. TaxID=2026352 RepID=UPI0035CB8049
MLSTIAASHEGREENGPTEAGRVQPQLGRIERWPFLDAVRLVAALLVVLGHLRSLFFRSITEVADPGLATKLFYLVTGVHREAMILFFVVSGFLIGGRAWQLLARGDFAIGRYVVARFSRIYVVLVPALGVTILIEAIGTGYLDQTRLFGLRPLELIPVTGGWGWTQLACHLASLQALACPVLGLNPPLWSLAYEWVF